MATRQLITDSDERKTRSRAATFVVPLGFAAAAGAALLAPTGTSHAAVTANDDTGMITPLLPDAQAVSARSANVSTSSRSVSRSAVPTAQADASQDDASTPTMELPLDDPMTLAHAVAQAKDDADAQAAAEAEAKAAAEKAAAEKAAAEKKAEAKKKAEAEKAAAEKAAAEKAAAEKAAAAKPDVVGTRYTTSGLNVRTGPSGEANVVDTLDPATKVSITDANQGNWQQIMYDGKARWVNEDYLAKSKPSTSSSSSSGGLSSSECSNGTTVLGGTGANGHKVHQAVCARFPSISTYGGNRGGSGNHGNGHAVDVMVSGSLGWEVANFLRANAKALGISELIYSQKIWTVQRSGEGWRSMSDRGSTTANHYDHVHVSTY